MSVIEILLNPLFMFYSSDTVIIETKVLLTHIAWQSEPEHSALKSVPLVLKLLIHNMGKQLFLEIYLEKTLIDHIILAI